MTQQLSNPDRRHFQRVHFTARATLSQNQHSVPVEIVDLCLNGVLVDHFNSREFDLKQPLQLRLELSEQDAIATRLRCAHEHQPVGDRRCGFQCDSIDLDSIVHLRRLVELNLGSASALDRDFSELLSCHNRD